MVLDPLGLKPLFGHTRRRRPDLVLRRKLDPLRLIAAMIYAPGYIQFGEARVHMIGPRLAPPLQQPRASPPATLLSQSPQPYLAPRPHPTPRCRVLPIHS